MKTKRISPTVRALAAILAAGAYPVMLTAADNEAIKDPSPWAALVAPHEANVAVAITSEPGATPTRVVVQRIQNSRAEQITGDPAKRSDALVHAWDAHHAAADARASAGQVVAESYGVGMGGMGGMGGYGAAAGGVARDADPFAAARMWLPNSPGERVLIIPGVKPDPKSQAQLQEDLTIMARLLEKTTRGKAGGSSLQAMNITIQSLGIPQSPKAIYLDGYGALFLLNVPFPLTPTAKPAAEKETKTSSTWEQTRNELYGRGEITGPGVFTHVTKTHAEPYDEEKVNQLKETLVANLKEAANIRGLKPDAWIVVCVQGAGLGADKGNLISKHVMVRRIAPSRGADAAAADEDLLTTVELDDAQSGADGTGSLLILRAKKTDVDALANNQLSLEEFRKKIDLLTGRTPPGRR